MRTALVNIGRIVTGDWREPFAAGDAILTDGGTIAAVGTLSAAQIAAADVVIDADGAIAIPGLIDSHVHITFGDYTPRQKNGRVSRKLPAWRRDDSDHRLGGACARPADGSRPASRHSRSRRRAVSSTTGRAACASMPAPSFSSRA